MKVRLGVVDCAISNLTSVTNAFHHIGVETELVREQFNSGEFTHLVLPGVGSFGTGMANLHRLNLVEPLKAAASDGVPLLGICLGMQLLAEEGHEFGCTAGLGLLPGTVSRMETGDGSLRLPHVGWNDVDPRGQSRLLNGLPVPPTFYFVHSYAFERCDATFVTGTANYGKPQVALVEHGNTFGTQFHPEKSQKQGMKLLENFISIESKDPRPC